MRRPRTRFFTSLTTFVTSFVLCSLVASPANAFGSLFTRDGRVATPAKRRIAIAFGSTSTTVWDQIQLASDSEVAYVVPVLSGTRVGVGSDAWLRALETSTDAAIYPPPSFDSVGCSCDDDGQDRGTRVNNPLSVIAPLETTTFASASTDDLVAWLTSRQLDVSNYAQTAFERVGAAGYEFAVFRYAPGCNVQALQPIVFTIPKRTTSFTLELLDVTASGPVHLSVFTMGSTRYRIATFPEATIDLDRLDWGHVGDESNFDSLLSEAQNRGVVTEFAALMPDVSPTAASQRRTSNPTLGEAYKFACVNTAPLPSYTGTCDSYTPSTPGVGDASSAGDASTDVTDASADESDASIDASADAEALTDAIAEAGTTPSDADGSSVDAGAALGPGYTADVCGNPDDMAVARKDLDPRSFVVTRLATKLSLPVGRTSLDFEPAPSADYVISVQSYDSKQDPNRMALCSSQAGPTRAGAVSVALALVTAIAVRFRSARRRAR